MCCSGKKNKIFCMNKNVTCEQRVALFSGGVILLRRVSRWLCAILFLLICAGVIWFLHLFTVSEETMTFVNWDSSVQVMEDGTEVPFSADGYSNMTEMTGTYRFTGQLPEGLPSGSLMFEISGCSLTLSLNGTEIYRSSVVSPPDPAYMPQATIPLSEGTSGTLTMTCEILDSTGVMFPPMLRFIPTNFTNVQDTTFANRAAFPAGATALALVLVVGLFFLGITLGNPNWSLLPLILATAGLVCQQIGQEQGAFFLPEIVYDILNRQEIRLVVIGLLLLYLFMNRGRQFFRYLGVMTAWSAAALALAYFVSMLQNGYLYSYINNTLATFISSGLYGNFTYWITFWLTVVCILISAYGTVRTFTRQQTDLENLQLKNQLTLNSYHAIEENMRKSAALRHEMKHNLTALDFLCQKEDYTGVKELLHTLLKQNEQQTQVHFTENMAINAILQDAASRAAKADISFEAQAQVPENLAIPEQDLCVLLMNMLDNALEACGRADDPKSQYIRFRCSSKNGFLAVHCENSLSVAVQKDKRGNIVTSKENAASHGFGIAQMRAVAEKYHSLLDIHYEPGKSFHVRTALKIPS